MYWGPQHCVKPSGVPRYSKGLFVSKPQQLMNCPECNLLINLPILAMTKLLVTKFIESQGFPMIESNYNESIGSESNAARERSIIST